ncbi:uncharacterized protein E5676_scaffold24967G00240 [Cucumis melo var. makuwa]|uniref:Uncharacterized protein n=1 Tax=Cucumis melo var. makuwa TaxID=1194695 RepID=A0A5D3BYM7_CUCMM|nr:uncharacterized protein E5676_scaffold24967G00240 [Cucumis melo var. makuwa]
MNDLGSFMVSYSIADVDLGRVLCDLEQLTDKSIACLESKIEDVFVKVDKFIFPTDFVILDYEAIPPQEFFEEEDSKGVLEVINVVYDARKFEPLNLQTKGEKKNKPSIKETQALKLKPLPNHLKYAFMRENDTLPIIIFAQLSSAEEKPSLKMQKCHQKRI